MREGLLEEEEQGKVEREEWRGRGEEGLTGSGKGLIEEEAGRGRRGEGLVENEEGLIEEERHVGREEWRGRGEGGLVGKEARRVGRREELIVKEGVPGLRSWEELQHEG